MRVKMLRPMFNAEFGNHHPGDVIDLPDEEAEARIAAGYCAPVDEPKRTLTERLRRRKDGAPETPDEGGPEVKPVDKMTVPELQAYAAARDIDLGEATLKRDILARIEAAQDADE